MKKVQIELTSKPRYIGDLEYWAECSIEGVDSIIEFTGYIGRCTRHVLCIYYNCFDKENSVVMDLENEDQENFEIINFDEFVPAIFNF